MKDERRMLDSSESDLDSLGQEGREEGRGRGQSDPHRESDCLHWILLTQNMDSLVQGGERGRGSHNF